MTDSPRLAELRRRLHGDPRSLAFAALAEELRRSGAWQEAIDTCVGGLVHHPDYTSARVTLGRALLEAGQPDAAREELEAVVGKVPENLAAQRALIEAYRELGLVAEAVAHCRLVCSLVPQSSEIAGLLEELDPSPTPAGAPPPRADNAVDTNPCAIDDDPLDEWPLLLVNPHEFGDAEAGSAPPPDVERAPGTGFAAVSDPDDFVIAFDRALDLELGVDGPAPEPATVATMSPPEPDLAPAATDSTTAHAATTGLPEQPPAGPEAVENALERFLAAIRRERGGPPPVDLAS